VKHCGISYFPIFNLFKIKKRLSYDIGYSNMKKFLNNLSDLLRECSKIWDDNMVVTASVLIQNMAFHANDWKPEQFEPYLNILRLMSELRPDNHTIQWAYSEARMEIDGYFMTQVENQFLHEEQY
jgi:hypothetical protein